MGKTLVDLETYKTNWHRETGNIGINTLAQRDKKHRDKYTGTKRQETQGLIHWEKQVTLGGGGDINKDR